MRDVGGIAGYLWELDCHGVSDGTRLTLALVVGLVNMGCTANGLYMSLSAWTGLEYLGLGDDVNETHCKPVRDAKQGLQLDPGSLGALKLITTTVLSSRDILNSKERSWLP